MKFWKMVSLLGSDFGKEISIASSKKEWEDFGIWLENFSQLVNIQDRSKLDYELPSDFIMEILHSSKRSFFVSTDGVIRSYRMSPEDEEVGAVAAFDRFGGDAMEEALEKGSFKP